jgi:5-formyltetrahydrofolate cyclo-ligase
MPDLVQVIKQGLRKKKHLLRNSLNEDFRQEASQAICQHIESWSLFLNSQVILFYLPMRSEVNLLSLVDKNPQKTWLVPRILSDGGMAFHLYNPAALVEHHFGMKEPDPESPSLPAKRIDLVLVPGLAYDRYGSRLGYGGGYYDRFLCTQTRCIRLGITFHALIQGKLPHADWDVSVQYLATEVGIQSVIIDLSD